MKNQHYHTLEKFNSICRGRFFTAVVEGKAICGKDPEFDGVNVTFKDRNKNFEIRSFPAESVEVD